MAEIEFSALQSQCLNRRIPSRVALEGEISTWQSQRNSQQSKIDWQFKTKDARIKLKKLYPNI